MNEIKALIVGNNSLGSTISQWSAVSGASLQQNVPNPVKHTTTINYSLPENYSSAYLMINDRNGKVLKQLSLSNKGNGTVMIDASTFASGAYTYSLVIDERIASTKQLLVTK
jgi:hypothetical protein